MASRKVKLLSFFSKKRAFTLAEVLIVLGIIGLIADMTIPTLISRTQEKVAAARLKKTYSTLDIALRLAVAENGTVDNWFEKDGSVLTNSTIFYENLTPYIKVMKNCGIKAGCWTKGYLRSITGLNYVDYDNRADEPKIQLADGTALMFWIGRGDCNPSCGNIKVDIDGLKGTYQWGKDVFVFQILKDRIIPSGSAQEQGENTFEEYCNMTKTYTSNGIACTAWVIYNENMDYLHCNDLSWDGKKSCR